MNNEVAWIDAGYKRYHMKEIEDSHLRNILQFVERGKGWAHFLQDDKIDALFSEAELRDIKHEHSISIAKTRLQAKRDLNGRRIVLGEW